MRKDFLKSAAVLTVLLAGLLLVGCGESRSVYAGKYRSVEPFAGKNYIDLELKESGKGSWTLGGKAVDFTWMVNDGRIWIYTKSGAILIVTPGEGGQMLSADMSGEWHPGCPPGSCVVFRRVPEGG